MGLKFVFKISKCLFSIFHILVEACLCAVGYPGPKFMQGTSVTLIWPRAGWRLYRVPGDWCTLVSRYVSFPLQKEWSTVFIGAWSWYVHMWKRSIIWFSGILHRQKLTVTMVNMMDQNILYLIFGRFSMCILNQIT